MIYVFSFLFMLVQTGSPIPIDRPNGERLELAIVEAIGKIGWATQDIEDRLGLDLTHESETRRLAAAVALLRLQISTEAATQCLVGLGTVDDSAIRSSAQAALVRYPRHVPMLLSSLQSTDAKVRRFVAELLGEIVNEEVVDKLAMVALRDPVGEVRHRALWALGGHGEEAVPPLVSSLRTRSDAPSAGLGLIRLGAVAEPRLRTLAAEESSLAAEAQSLLRDIERLNRDGSSWSRWHTRDGLAFQVGTGPRLLAPGNALHASIRLLNISDEALAIRRDFVWEASGMVFMLKADVSGDAVILRCSQGSVPRPNTSSYSVLEPYQMAEGERWFVLSCQGSFPEVKLDCQGLPALINEGHPTCIEPGSYTLQAELSDLFVDHPSRPSVEDFETALSASLWRGRGFTVGGSTAVVIEGCDR